MRASSVWRNYVVRPKKSTKRYYLAVAPHSTSYLSQAKDWKRERENPEDWEIVLVTEKTYITEVLKG